jgi:MORN repeat
MWVWIHPAKLLLIEMQEEYKYEGEYNHNNQRHGKGHAWFMNGDEYEGQYKEGRRSGRGLYRLAVYGYISYSPYTASLTGF